MNRFRRWVLAIGAAAITLGTIGTARYATTPVNTTPHEITLEQTVTREHIAPGDVVVQKGDGMWSAIARQLPEGTSDAQIGEAVDEFAHEQGKMTRAEWNDAHPNATYPDGNFLVNDAKNPNLMQAGSYPSAAVPSVRSTERVTRTYVGEATTAPATRPWGWLVGGLGAIVAGAISVGSALFGFEGYKVVQVEPKKQTYDPESHRRNPGYFEAQYRAKREWSEVDARIAKRRRAESLDAEADAWEAYLREVIPDSDPRGSFEDGVPAKSLRGLLLSDDIPSPSARSVSGAPYAPASSLAAYESELAARDAALFGSAHRTYEASKPTPDEAISVVDPSPQPSASNEPAGLEQTVEATTIPWVEPQSTSIRWGYEYLAAHNYLDRILPSNAEQPTSEPSPKRLAGAAKAAVYGRASRMNSLAAALENHYVPGSGSDVAYEEMIANASGELGVTARTVRGYVEELADLGHENAAVYLENRASRSSKGSSGSVSEEAAD